MSLSKVFMWLLAIILIAAMFLIFHGKSDNNFNPNPQMRISKNSGAGPRGDDPQYASEVATLTAKLKGAQANFDKALADKRSQNDKLQVQISDLSDKLSKLQNSNTTSSVQKELQEFAGKLEQISRSKDKEIADLQTKYQVTQDDIKAKLKKVEEQSQQQLQQLKNKFNSTAQTNNDSKNNDTNLSMDALLSRGNTTDNAGQIVPSQGNENNSGNNPTTYTPTTTDLTVHTPYGARGSKGASGENNSVGGVVVGAADNALATFQDIVSIGPFQDHTRLTNSGKKQTLWPVYTLPINTDISNATLATPMIGRVPMSGNVADPFQFKVIINRENLAANGFKIPGVARMIASGIAIGDRDQSCVRGKIINMVFIFEDGRISTIGGDKKNAGKGNNSSTADGLGYIADPWGKPCIRGIYVNNAGQYLESRSAAAFLEGLSQAWGQGQVSYTQDSNGGTNAMLSGNSYQFAFANGVSNTAKEVADYVKSRAADAWDLVYVSQAQQIQIFLDKQVNIDYDTKARKVNYIGANNDFKYD